MRVRLLQEFMGSLTRSKEGIKFLYGNHSIMLSITCH